MRADDFEKTSCSKCEKYPYLKVELLNKVENIVTKGEIKHDEYFLLLSQFFFKLSVAEASKCVYRWERVNDLVNCIVGNNGVEIIMSLLISVK